jgi:hypothetical protein
MKYKSLKDFIETCRHLGQVVDVHGADLDLEVGCLTELAYEQDGPMLLFDQFKGFPSDFSVVSNVFRNNIGRWALALGFPPDSHPLDLVKSLRERRREQKMMAPAVESIQDGKRVALYASGGLSHFTASYPWPFYKGPCTVGSICQDFDRKIVEAMREGRGSELSRLKDFPIVNKLSEARRKETWAKWNMSEWLGNG